MTFKEMRALIFGYVAAPAKVREKMLELVPDLIDAVWDAPPPDELARWEFKAVSEGQVIKQETIICREKDLDLYKQEFILALPFAASPTIHIKKL